MSPKGGGSGLSKPRKGTNSHKARKLSQLVNETCEREECKWTRTRIRRRRRGRSRRQQQKQEQQEELEMEHKQE